MFIGNYRNVKAETNSYFCNTFSVSYLYFYIDCTQAAGILILSQMVTTSRSIPSLPGPSSVSVATQTVVRTYVNASVQAVSVRCMPRAEFLAKMRELVQENALNRVYVLLREMRSSLEAVVTGNELVLNVELA